MREYLNQQVTMANQAIETAKKLLESAQDQHAYLEAKEMLNYNLGKLEILKSINKEMLSHLPQVFAN